MTSDDAARVNIEIRLSQIASYNAIRIKEFTRLFELDSDSVIMYDIIYYVLWTTSRTCDLYDSI